MQTLLRDPLCQFLIIAALLYGLQQHFGVSDFPDAHNDRAITITDVALINFMQTQQKSFSGPVAVQTYKAMTDDAREVLKADFIRSEVLYREALSKGLDQNDEIIRRRLIQKMDYIAEGFYDTVPAATEAALGTYYQAHLRDYYQPAKASFTHIYFNPRSHDNAGRAVKSLKDLIDLEKPSANQAGRYGDRFLYQRAYADRTVSEIDSHFGAGFGATISNLAKNTWAGPIISDVGVHFVMLHTYQAGYQPSLKEIAPIVLGDLQRDQLDAVKRRAVDDIIAKYQITDVRAQVIK